MTNTTDDTPLVPLVLILIGVVLIAPVFLMGFGMMGFGSMMGGMWGGGMWGGGMWGDGTSAGWTVLVGVAMQLLFLAVLVGGGYLVYRTTAGRDDDSDRAIEELRLAYARGDLTDDEYEQRRAALDRDSESRDG
ncbi:putative membrane protein [Halopenitus malekzadehii]|uniref:Putative membrane protein n=1 Tax=Halopenitus malekzadehii TaxID=1267564 RepID=A0A1H6JYZ7_9EURY|nr:SHOCT domain-containing protein [Halopenitus malekzadehii]SEH64578.1 putative membrane protein [Halopenitus malekzadehii]